MSLLSFPLPDLSDKGSSWQHDAVYTNGMVLRYLTPAEKTREVVLTAVKSVGLALAWAGVWQSRVVSVAGRRGKEVR